MTSRWHWISGLLLLAASTVSAQDSASHIQLDGQNAHDRAPADLAQQLMKQVSNRPPQAGSVEPEAFKRFIDMVKNKSEVDAKQQIKNDDELMRLLRNLDLHDPAIQREFDQQNKKIPDPKLTNQREQLRDFLTRLKKDFNEESSKQSQSVPGSGLPPPPHIESMRGPPDFSKQKGPTEGSSSDTPRRTPRTSQPGKQVDPVDHGRQQQFKQDLGKSLERWFPKMGNSPAMRRVVDDLANKDFSKSASSRFWKEGKLPDVNWNRVGRNMDRTGHFLDRNLSGLGKTNLPDAPRLDGPNLPQGPQMAGMGGAPSGGDVLELGKAGSIIVTILALLIGGFVLWRFLLKPLSQVRLKPTENGVGDWPVNPWLIRTREELVKAFDYLTLLKCGLPAKMWHHHEVAEHLSEEAQRPHADNLANVYEQARYSPPPETIPEPVMDRARQDLCLLAGEAAP